MRRALATVALFLAGGAPALVRPVAAEIVGDFPEVVLFATNSIKIDQNATVVTGDVVANRVTAGATLDPPFELSLGNKVALPAGWEAKAHRLKVGNFATLAGSVFCNQVSGPAVCAPLAPLPVYGQLPVFQTAPAGATPIVVPNKGTVNLPPGTYGDITAGLETRIHFVGTGIWNVGSITVGRKGELTFTGPAEVRVAGSLVTGIEDNINLSGPPASKVVFYVNGPGGAQLGSKTTVRANVYAPNGLLEVGPDAIATGAFLGRDLMVGSKAQVTLATFFDFQPVAQNDAATTPEDTAVSIAVLANDSDPEGDPIFVNAVTQGAHGAVTFTAGGVTYTPAPDFFGTDSFTYEVCDVETPPAVNEDNCANATVSVSVTSVNDPPVAAADSATTPEDTAVLIAVLANDTAGPANEVQTLTLDAVSDPTHGRAEIVGTQVRYTPNADFSGADGFQYTACDGGQDDNPATDADDLCATAAVAVTVTPVNDAPSANAQDVFTAGDVNLPITLTAFDPDGDVLTYTLAAAPAAGALLGLPANDAATPGSVTATYDPASGDDSPDQFVFQVADGNGGVATATVRINPGPADPGGDPPPPLAGIVAKSASVETAKNTPVELLLVAAAPIAPAPGAIDDLVFAIVSGPGSGSLSALAPIDPVTEPIRSATVTYTPAPDTTGTASFVFEACEAAQPANCDAATVTIEVRAAAAAAPPTAVGQSATTTVNTPVALDLAGTPGTSPAPGDDGRPPLALRQGGPQALGSGGGNGARPAAAMAGVEYSHGGGTPAALTVGAGWSATTAVPPAFFWSGTIPVFATDGPFTFTLTGPGCVSVTDDFKPGDQFRLYDNDEAIGETPAVSNAGPDVEQGPDAAYADPAYSSATFALGAGSHSIEIEVIGISLSGGRGYLRADTAGSPFCANAAGQRLSYRILTLPASGQGTLLDSTGAALTGAPVILPTSGITFQPATGFAGVASFTFSVIDKLTLLESAAATVDVTVFDNVACTVCVSLAVNLAGGGSGDVRLEPNPAAGTAICTESCSVSYAPGAVVKLQARPLAGSTFGGWSGACSGTSAIAAIVLPASGGTACTATFNAVP